MTYIPQAGNHGLMIEMKSEEAACLAWEHEQSADPDLREKYRPDANDTCLCRPYGPGIPRGFFTEDGPHTKFADVDISAVMNMWGQHVSLSQRLAWYDEAAGEETEYNDPIWVD